MYTPGSPCYQSSMRSLLGVNLPYFGDSYAHDMAKNARLEGWPCDFDLGRAHEALVLARSMNLEAVRIWLCEGGEGIDVDAKGHVTGVKPELLDAIKGVQAGAAISGVRIYWTLLDANGPMRDGDMLTHSILADADQAARFAEHVAAPIARVVDEAIAIGVDVINEPETVTVDCADVKRDHAPPFIEWETIGGVIARARDAIRAERGRLLVTSGTTRHFLPKLWRAGATLDALDLHVYHVGGGLPPRAALEDLVGDPAIATIPIIAGECGIPKEPGRDENALVNFLYNADKGDYQAVFLWKLAGDLVDTSEKRPKLTQVGRYVRDAIEARPATGFDT